jgi:putative transposase
MRNLLVKVPRHAQAMVASLVRTIFAQERPQDAWAQLERVVEQLHAGRFTDAAGLLERAAPDVLAYTAFPRDVGKKCWSNNPQERLNKRSAAARTWSGSSRAATRSSAWSVRAGRAA